MADRADAQADGEIASFPFPVGLRRPATAENWLRWDPEWTVALATAVRRLRVPYRLKGDTLWFVTAGDRDKVVAKAVELHANAVVQLRKLMAKQDAEWLHAPQTARRLRQTSNSKRRRRDAEDR